LKQRLLQQGFNLTLVGALFLTLNVHAQRFGYRTGQEYRSLNTDSYEIAIQKNGRLDVAHASGAPIFLDAYPMVWIEGEKKPERFKLDGRFSQRYEVHDRLGQGHGMLVKFKTLEWTLNSYPAKPFIAVQAAFVNTTKKPIAIKALYPWVVGGNKKSGLSLGVGSPQSHLVPDPLLSNDIVQGTAFTSKNCIGIYNPRTGRTLTAGFVSQNSAVNGFFIEPLLSKNENIIPEFQAINTYDPPIELQPGERLESEILYIALTETNPVLGMQRYGKAVSVVNEFSRKEAISFEGLHFTPQNNGLTKGVLKRKDQSVGFDANPFLVSKSSHIYRNHPERYADHRTLTNMAVLDITQPGSPGYLKSWISSVMDSETEIITSVSPSSLTSAVALGSSNITKVEAVQLARTILLENSRGKIAWVEPLSEDYVIPNEPNPDGTVYAMLPTGTDYQDQFWKAHYLKNTYARDIALLRFSDSMENEGGFYEKTNRLNSFETINLGKDFAPPLSVTRKMRPLIPADWIFSTSTQMLVDTSTNPPGEWLTVHLFNSQNKERKLNILIPALGGRKDLNYTLYDQGNAKYLGLVRNRFTVDIGAEKIRSFSLKVYQRRPMLLTGSSELLSQSQENINGNWNRKTYQLSGEFNGEKGETRALQILHPEGYTVSGVTVDAKIQSKELASRVFSLEIEPAETGIVQWSIRFDPPS